jgi:aminocarboxymuconate-semialdehyde decarboxylase
MNDADSAGWSVAPRRSAIDFHAHILVPEVYAVAFPHSIACRTADAATDDESRRLLKARQDFVLQRMSDVIERVARMDAMGVDVQVLSSSHVHQSTWWAEPKESLRLERALNDYIARVVAANSRRFAGLGGVPLPEPELAIPELRRCVRDLGLVGVAISTTARDMELGDPRLRPFWAAAEELGALIYIHPAGNQGARFRNYSLWNSIGQAFEEAMAIASLMYEGTLDAFPRLKICVSHGGGYMPFYMGRILRNYAEKPTSRVNMKRSPIEYLRMLYYDSCVYETEVLAQLVQRVGADRIVLGSDYPVGDPKPVEFVEAAAITAQDKKKIIGTNAATLLGISALA